MTPEQMRDIDKQELMACLKKGYTVPRFVRGVMDDQQWKCWLRLHRMGLAHIEGLDEAEYLEITIKGSSLIRGLLGGDS